MRMMNCLLVVLVAGCATTQLPNAPTETKIPVGVPCLTRDQVPMKPDFVTDAQLVARLDDQLVLTLARERLDRIEYEGRLEAVVAGCASDVAVPEPATIFHPTTSPSEPNKKPWWKFW